MTKYIQVSKIIHWITICCFFFPFFYTGCGEKAEEATSDEVVIQDSTYSDTTLNHELFTDSISLTFSDSSKQQNVSESDSSSVMTTESKQDTAKAKAKKDTDELSQRICNKFGFLQFILIPEPYTYTGLALVIDIIPFLPYLSIFLCFLFLIISLVVKFMEPNASKSIVLFELLALIFIFIAEPYYSWGMGDKLWGIWLTTLFLIILSVYDIYLFRRLRK
jgi:hypothetical protein